MSAHKKNQSISNIIFDLSGVLFTINIFRLCISIGILSSLWYFIIRRKNPFKTSLEILRAMHHEEKEHRFPIIYYKIYPLPDCISASMHGQKTNHESLKEIERYIERFAKKRTYF